MSVSKIVTINCDDCLTWIDAGVADTASAARACLKRLGWLVNVPDPDYPRNRNDYCPKCRAERSTTS